MAPEVHHTGFKHQPHRPDQIMLLYCTTGKNWPEYTAKRIQIAPPCPANWAR